MREAPGARTLPSRAAPTCVRTGPHSLELSLRWGPKGQLPGSGWVAARASVRTRAQRDAGAALQTTVFPVPPASRACGRGGPRYTGYTGGLAESKRPKRMLQL